MDTMAAVDFSHESATLDAANADMPKVAGPGRWRILALIALSALSTVGFAYALMKTLVESKAGSAAAASERILRRPEELSAVGVAITVALIVVVALVAAAIALRQTTDE